MSDCFNTLQNEKGIVKYIDFQKSIVKLIIHYANCQIIIGYLTKGLQKTGQSKVESLNSEGRITQCFAK